MEKLFRSYSEFLREPDRGSPLPGGMGDAQARTGGVTAYEFGEWRVEPELGCVRRGQDRRHLEPKALEVLTYLLADAGQVISTEILDFMRKLDVTEIHGYRAEFGLRVFTEEAIAAIGAN